jgi:hypothetical protein
MKSLLGWMYRLMPVILLTLAIVPWMIGAMIPWLWMRP